MKRSYSAFLEAVEAVGRDSLEKTKTKAVAVVAELLAGHPEQVLLLFLLLHHHPTPHKGGNTIELPSWKKGWHRLRPLCAVPLFLVASSFTN